MSLQSMYNLFQRKTIREKTLLWAALLFLFSSPTGALPATFSPVCQITYSGSSLSLHAENVSLVSVLSQIQEKTGIQFQMQKDVSDINISVRFDSLSLEAGIKRILSQTNHVLLLTPDGDIQEVIVLGTMASRTGSGSAFSGFSNDQNVNPSTNASLKSLESRNKKSSAPLGAKTERGSIPSSRENVPSKAGIPSPSAASLPRSLQDGRSVLPKQNMGITSPEGKEMSIQHPSGDMPFISTPAKDMGITHPKNDMGIIPPGKQDMGIQPPSKNVPSVSSAKSASKQSNTQRSKDAP
jgi:hypothetical protein